MEAEHLPVGSRATQDPESRAWVSELALPEGQREAAVGQLHAYLVRVARFELARRSATLAHLQHGELDDLAVQSADDALMAILRKLHTFRGDSRFTTWAGKFAILEASVKARRRAWQHREISMEPGDWESAAADYDAVADRSAAGDLDQAELLRALGHAIRTALTPHQRDVLVAITLNGVPIDVLAERLNTTRGALYKTLHDARRKLRAKLTETEAI